MFSRATGAFRADWLVILSLTILLASFPAIAVAWWEHDQRQVLASGARTDIDYGELLLILGGLLVHGIAFSIYQAALTRLVLSRPRGRKAALGKCLGSALSMVLPLTAITLLSYIGIFLGGVALLVPGLMLWTAWMVVIPVQVEERRDLLASFGRSLELTRGARWPIFGAMFGLVLAIVALSLLLEQVLQLIDITNLLVPTLLLAGTIAAIESLAFGLPIASLYVELRKVHDDDVPDELETIFA